MSNSLRIINVVEEICARQDEVLRELDELDRRIEAALLALSPRTQGEPAPQKAAA